jgi:hypothetical protein
MPVGEAIPTTIQEIASSQVAMTLVNKKLPSTKWDGRCVSIPRYHPN